MTASDCLPHQVTINKPELSARWGITLESKPQIGGAPKAPTITKLADGGLAIASGKIKVTHLLIAVNGTIVKGHEDGTTLLKNAVGNTELTLYAPEIAAAKAAAAALAAGERPLPIGIGKTSSSWKKVPSASRPGGIHVLTTAPSLLSPHRCLRRRGLAPSLTCMNRAGTSTSPIACPIACVIACVLPSEEGLLIACVVACVLAF